MLQMTKRVQIPVALTALFGLIFLLQKNVLKGVFFAVGIGVPVLALLIGSAVVPPVRPLYMFYALPLIFALAAFLCDQTRQALSNYRFASHALTIIVVFSLLIE